MATNKYFVETHWYFVRVNQCFVHLLFLYCGQNQLIYSFIFFRHVMSGAQYFKHTFFCFVMGFLFYMICTIFCILYRDAAVTVFCAFWTCRCPLFMVQMRYREHKREWRVRLFFLSSVTMPADSVFQLLMAYCSEVNIDPCALVYCTQFVFVPLDPSHP